jgi:hypothetical protein
MKINKTHLDNLIDEMEADPGLFTAENIAIETEYYNGKANKAAINYIYRGLDQSHLWPVENRFNVTERAIRKTRIFEKFTGKMYGLEYCLSLEQTMSDIINNL